MYAIVLLDGKEYLKARKFILISDEEFYAEYKDVENYTDYTRAKYIKLKSNIAEICLECSKNVDAQRTKKYEYLNEAKIQMLKALNNNSDGMNDNEYAQLYENAIMVFSELRDYYSE